LLDKVKGVSIVKLDKRDVIRHKLVESVIDRYDIMEAAKKKKK